MPKKSPDPITKEEIEAIMKAVSEDPNTERRHYYSLLFNLLRYTGRRLGELYGVNMPKKVKVEKWTDENGVERKRTIYKKSGEWMYGVKFSDVDEKNKYLYTMVLKKKQRIKKPAKLTEELIRQIKDFKLTYKLKDDDYIFRNNKVARSYTECQIMFKQYAKKAGITKKNLSIHSLRHYVITHLRKKGWSYEDIAKVTGHSTPSVIGIYDDSTLADVENKLEEDFKDL